MADDNRNQSIGDTIRGIVEDAVKSAVNGVGDGIRSIFASTNPNPEVIDEPKGPPKNLSDVDVGNHSNEHHTPKDPSVPSYVKTKFRPPQLYKSANAELSSGKRETVGGGVLAGIGGTVSLSYILTMVFGQTVQVPLMFAAILGTGVAAFGLSLLVKGLQKKGRAGRFSEYLQALGEKTMIKLEDLAQSAGRSISYIRKDVQDMMDRRLFQQGHLSNVDGDQYLITADQTYKNLLEYKEYSERKTEEERYLAEQREETDRQVEAQLRESGLSTAGIQIVMEGRRHLTDIERLNSEIPDAEITEKLQKMAALVRELLAAVTKNPGKAGDLRKVMNYYLPTAKNLLNTYIEIDKAPRKTEENLKTQKDISGTLDKLNTSFDNLLRQIQTHEKWNVNAEIRVLNSMLEMEGLGEDPIRKPSQKRAETNKDTTQ
ncbi:MAG: 5-bromo-4-chloroindolyl phosphate hydrolysis family protein [Lachnospiraceae bacterium]|nr:5-bromo-4-chloroindolyl phosphate hydrolysis family protein [Lachnospiraceae bacterium]